MLTSSEKMTLFFQLKEKKQKIEDYLGHIKNERGQAQKNIMEDMKAAGVSQLKDEKGRTVFLQKPKVYASFKKDMKEEAMALLKTPEWGCSDFCKETIPPIITGKINRVL